MARVVIPVNFDEQTKLFTKIKAKHDADGAGSVLNMLLAEHNIDLAADEIAKNKAIAADGRQDEEHKETRASTRERDRLFKAIFKSHKKMVQFLKGFYNYNLNRLGNWGVNVVGGIRIAYPSGFYERINCVKLFVEKYNSLPPADNPLTLYLANNPEVVMPTIATLDQLAELHENSGKLDKNAEQATEERNVLWLPVMAHVRIIAFYLKSMFHKNPSQIWEYGFVVSYAKKSHKYRNSSIKFGHSKIVSGVVMGGEFLNKGNTELLIFKGRKIKGEPIKILPNSCLIIPKGYSNITIVNPSNIETGKYQVLLRKS